MQRMLGMVVIDKFFLIGAAAGLFGSLILGVYVWLLRLGLLPMTSNYSSMRELHATLQFYLFLTPFILGFLLQSATKLFETSKPLPGYVRLALPGTILSAIALLTAPSALTTRLVLAMSIWLVAVSLVRPFLATSWSIRLRFGFFTLIGLFSLGVGAFSDLSVPQNSLLLFWMGIVPVILGTAQQFIGGALGGKRPSISASLLTLVLFGATGILLTVAHEPLSFVTSLLATATFIAFLVSTNARVILQRSGEPLAITFIFGHLWALVGSGILIYGPLHADSALHIWGIGYAVTLIIGVSIRLIGRITDVQSISERAQIMLIVAWQVVCFARGLNLIFHLPIVWVWLGAFSAALVLIIWLAAIAYSVGSMACRQLRHIHKTRQLHQQKKTTTHTKRSA